MDTPPGARSPAPRSEFVHRRWPAEPDRLVTIRAEVRLWLASLRLTDAAREDLLCAVSEAASNSIEHAYPAAAAANLVELTFWTEADRVWIEIVDRGRWRSPPTGRTGRGLGIAMMQRLVDSVLIRYDERGTRVLLGHPLPGDARELPVDQRGPTSLDASGIAQRSQLSRPEAHT